jgi:succinyl-CoA synthetase beta subunit
VKLHEYQSKRLFAEFGVPIPHGDVATTVDEVRRIAKELGGSVVVKSQVLVGGRGKAGGIKLAATPDKAAEAGERILGMSIKGLRVKRVLVEQASDIDREIYFGIVIDRTARRVVVMASAEGGVEIEQIAQENPGAIIRVPIDPFLGLRIYQANQIAMAIGLDREQFRAFANIARALYDAFKAYDASLAEINPLIVDSAGHLLAVDGKMVIDDNALFRHPKLAEMRDVDEETESEREARLAGLSYVELDGKIGCMVNGAGLAMTTMDLTKLFGGSPANFLDIGGGAQADKVAVALRLILADPHVQAVLFNIFGGITRCDEVAHGILAALEEVKPKVPMVVRLVGTNEDEGRAILAESAYELISATTLAEAARKAVTAANKTLS